jgi:hypothetical protein
MMILMVICAITTGAALVLAIRKPPAPVSKNAGEETQEPKTVSPRTIPTFLQKDTVTPGNKYTGQVYYPIPYFTAPNLRIHGDDSKRVYEVVKEDEYGFTWSIQPTVDDVVGTITFSKKPIADFTWEARGLRGNSSVMRPYEQTGTFSTLPDTDGEVVYTIPYQTPANVELSGGAARHVVITECRAMGFKWRSRTRSDEEDFTGGIVTWKARGLREKLARLAPIAVDDKLWACSFNG